MPINFRVRADLFRLSVLVVIALGLAVATIVIVDDLPILSPGGETLFVSKGCSGCHTLAGVADSAQIGPNLTDMASVAGFRVTGLSAAEYVGQSIREPEAFTVPGFEAGFASMPTLPVTDVELIALVELLLQDR